MPVENELEKATASIEKIVISKLLDHNMLQDRILMFVQKQWSKYNRVKSKRVML